MLIGDDDQAVLCDFGLHRLERDVVSDASTTISALFLADNPFWMSPEYLAGRQPETSSDVYAFGMMIFEVR